MATFKKFDVVVVPFPFTDSPETKRRPALVLSQQKFNSGGQTVLAMVTSTANKSRPFDIQLGDWQNAGLTAASTLRWKVFTLDNDLILRKLGQLSPKDQTLVAKGMRAVF